MVGHQYLTAVLQAAGFKRNVCKWVSRLYHSPSAVIQVNGKWLHAFALGRSDRVACFCSYFIFWRWSWLRYRACSQTCMESLSLEVLEPGFLCTLVMYPFLCCATATLTWHRRGLNGMKRWRGGKINRSKSSGLWLGAWKGVTLLRPFQLDRWTHLHFWSVVWVWLPTEEELVKSTGKGQSGGPNLALPAVVHKE